jgi:hypothetical protein
MPQCSFGVIRRCFLLCGVLASLAVTAAAKRVAPKDVPPVVANGVRYSVAGDGRSQYIVTQDAATDKMLWKVLVFRTRIAPLKEEDNQWVFIDELRLTNRTLFVRDEKSRCYSIDVSAHRVKKQSCGGSAP